MAASGQCVAAYPLARAVVESALYGWYLSTDVAVAKRWNEKPVKRKSPNKWGEEFRFGTLSAKLEKVKAGRGQWAKSLHQTAIDFGAHPNADGLYSNMSKQRLTDSQVLVQMKYLHELNRPSLLANKFVIENGLFALELFGTSFAEPFKDMGLSEALAAHTVRLGELIEDARDLMNGDSDD